MKAIKLTFVYNQAASMGRVAICTLFVWMSIVIHAAGIALPDTAKIRIPTDPKSLIAREVAPLPSILKEASGLEYHNGIYWSHNDDGVPAIYCLDSLGQIIRVLHVNATNKGWEDIAFDEDNTMYIGGFGNNNNNNKELKIYKIANASKEIKNPANPEVIRYKYSDQKSFPPGPGNKNFDVDAFFVWNDDLYLFTKDRSVPARGYTKVYKLRTDGKENVAQLIDSLYIGAGPMINNWVTAADISPDKKTIALLLHDRVLFIKDFNPQQFSRGRIYQLKLNHYSHKAGLCFRDHDTLNIVDELEFGLIGGKLYSVDLKPYSKFLSP